LSGRAPEHAANPAAARGRAFCLRLPAFPVLLRRGTTIQRGPMRDTIHLSADAGCRRPGAA
jgi:hypothetical protein